MAETKKIVKASEGYHLTPLNLSKDTTKTKQYYKPYKYLKKKAKLLV